MSKRGLIVYGKRLKTCIDIKYRKSTSTTIYHHDEGERARLLMVSATGTEGDTQGLACAYYTYYILTCRYINYTYVYVCMYDVYRHIRKGEEMGNGRAVTRMYINGRLTIY